MTAATAQSSPKSITIRRAQPEDIEVCGRICFEAFTTLNRNHNFPPDFPTPEVAVPSRSILRRKTDVWAGS